MKPHCVLPVRNAPPQASPPLPRAPQGPQVQAHPPPPLARARPPLRPHLDSTPSLCSLSHCALLAFSLLLHNKFPQNLVAKTTIAFIISPGFCGTGIRERLSWAVLAQGLQGGCRQRVCSHPEAGPGLGVHVQDGSRPWRRDPEGRVSAPPSSDLRSLKGRHTPEGEEVKGETIKKPKMFTERGKSPATHS